MKYLSASLVLLAVAGCAEHHDLTQCKGPYLALAAPTPPPVAADAPKLGPLPLTPAAPTRQPTVAGK